MQIELTEEQVAAIKNIPEFYAEFPEFLSSYITEKSMEITGTKCLIFCPVCGRAKYHCGSSHSWRLMDLHDYVTVQTRTITEEICCDCHYDSLTSDRITAIKRLKQQRLRRSN